MKATKKVHLAKYDSELQHAALSGDKTEDILNKQIFSYTYYGNYAITHRHDYWEFIIVLSGNYTHVLNHKNFQLNKNQACLMRPLSDAHSLKNAPYGSSHHTIRIKDSFMREICNKFNETFYEDLINRPLILLTLNDEQTNRIINYTTIISSRTASASMLSSYFLTMYLLEKIVGEANFFEENKPKWFSEILLKINAPQNLHWSVNDILNACNVSHTHLLRAFKKYENCSIVEYLTNFKMSKACSLLLYSNMSILDIALQLGYSDSSHFGRTFKRLYEISPMKFKQNANK